MVLVDPKTNTITLTRGDTLRVKFVAKKDGEPYVYQTGDKLVFYCAPQGNQRGTLQREIPTDTGELYLTSSETKDLRNSSYLYDIELKKANGDVDTIINRAKIVLMDEVG